MDAEAPIVDAAITGSVEIGTGADRFIPVMAGEVVEIILGPQGGGRNGGYHLWHSLRARDVDPIAVSATFRTFLAAGREEIAVQTRTFDLQPGGGGSYVAFGIAPQLQDCCRVERADVIMRIELTTSGGVITDERQVRASDRCVDGMSGASICP
jgi:hypothetical protein